jgi:hypothetical protein
VNHYDIPTNIRKGNAAGWKTDKEIGSLTARDTLEAWHENQLKSSYISN